MKVLIVGHGAFPDGLASAMSVILGPQVGVSTLSLGAGEDLEGFSGRLREHMEMAQPHPTEPVIVLADLLGGTPANAALRVASQMSGMHVLTGANLPLLLKLLDRGGQGEVDSGRLAAVLQEGRNGIVNALELLNQEVRHE